MHVSADIKVGDSTTLKTAPIEKQPYQPIVWRNVILCSLIHLGALYGVYLAFTSAKITTTIFAIGLYQISAIGITAGAHRLWSHRAYKAKWQLRLIIITLNTIAFQNSVYEWARDHRLHHKYCDTNADPHNSNRGLFFSHVGWLLCRKHPDVIEKGRTIDTSDLLADPIVTFQKKYFWFLITWACFIIPTLIPVYCWGETWRNSWYVAVLLRYTLTLNAIWLVNSAAHAWGGKPYDRFINASENLVASILSVGEGWHNYHHVFPWDYKTAELGNYHFNYTTAFIHLFAKIGWAYDLKTTSTELVRKRASRTGLVDSGGDPVPLPWGWDDKDCPQSDRMEATIVNRKQG
ncbi:acyl-CoA Delta-9 desaturase-like [Aphis gossypii]|uniref:acyl-CoA Delta-9 desaturase-like n=1 Tax=Aphis gossypii TaxID=80765 RepID=UPI002159572F|nr:acyl-CoA Delta-9 desaturase-like [Aphis gossypii]XP_050054935.1 acyl-CoA Delta-9 desaturase-like [Aphis gossypii]XP_050054936.1 acyl-CoA Delta-9 desaturase-like [Aphis gossypii]